MMFKFEEMHHLLNKWKPESTPWCRIRTPVQLIEGDWDCLSGSQKSYHIARAEGFVFGTSVLSKTDQIERANLFPLTFKSKICPIHYMKGILDGLVRASVIEIVNKRHVMHRIKPRESLMGSISHLIHRIGQSPSLTTLWRTDEFLTLFSSSKHQIPSSYPLKDQDLGTLNTKKWIGLFGISTEIKEPPLDFIHVPRITNPIISGLRTFQCATGSHYKIRGIMRYFDIKPHDVLCGADGSGGISSMSLRDFPHVRLIYNSLLNMSGVSLRGSNPSPPTAIHECAHVRSRCVNLEDVWQNPSDLCLPETWSYFRSLTKKWNLKLNLMVFDLEYLSDKKMMSIENNIVLNLDLIKKNNSCIIYKTYLNVLYNNNDNIITTIGCLFKIVQLAYTETTSSHSSEVYVIMQYLKTDQYIEAHIQKRRLISDTLSWPVFQSLETEILRAYN